METRLSRFVPVALSSGRAGRSRRRVLGRQLGRALVRVAERRRALGALAVGSLALGAFAIGALVVGRLAIRQAAIRSLKIQTLEVGALNLSQPPIFETTGPTV